MKKKALIVPIALSLLSALLILFAAWLPGQYQVPVLMYHAVARSWFEPLNNVQPEHFDRQMAYLKRRGYKVISVDQFIDEEMSGRPHDRKSVVITFDDGYDNNHGAAYPVLRKYGFPATVFVEVARLGTPGYLSWDQVRDMDAHGMTVGSHTMTGAYLPGLPHTQAVQEIMESKRLLEMSLGRTVRFLAYPIGGFSDDIKRAVREAGYAAAFTSNRGYRRRSRDLYEIRRIRVKDSDGSLQLWVKLSGYYNFFRSVKKPF